MNFLPGLEVTAVNRNVTILIVILVILLVSGYLLWLRGRFVATQMQAAPTPTREAGTPTSQPTLTISPSITASPSGVKVSPTSKAAPTSKPTPTPAKKAATGSAQTR